MKTFSAALLALCCLAFAVVAQDKHHAAPPPAEDGGTVTSADVIKRGATIGGSPQVSFADALKEPQKYAGRTIRLAGVVRRVCKMEGCWMEIGPAVGDETVRVTFKGHTFFVPKDADEMKFRAEGELKVKKLSREEVEHLVKEDGAKVKVKTNPDGTADEVTFIATGVELWKQERPTPQR